MSIMQLSLNDMNIPLKTYMTYDCNTELDNTVLWRHQTITWTNIDLSLTVFCGI